MTYNTDWSLEVENREFVLFSNFVNCQPSTTRPSLAAQAALHFSGSASYGSSEQACCTSTYV